MKYLIVAIAFLFVCGNPMDESDTQLELDKHEVTLAIVEGEAAIDSFVISNLGKDKASYDIKDNASWISYNATSGILQPNSSSSDKIIVTLSTSTLAAGSYQGKITVEASNSTSYLYYNLIVAAKPQMSLIPGGTYTIGAMNGYDDEKPTHQVSLTSFYMDQTEVTIAHFHAIANSQQESDSYTDPMITVSWYSAIYYCNQRSKREGFDTCYTYTSLNNTSSQTIRITGMDNLACDFNKNGYRLPTEAEWEAAARGGDTTDYFWGKNYDNYPATNADTLEIEEYCVWYPERNHVTLLSEVKTRKPNGYGLYDMLGNTFEWCYDWYSETYYSSSPSDNPKGPSSGTYKVLRSGPWWASALELRASYRDYAAPDITNGYTSVRCVRNQ